MQEASASVVRELQEISANAWPAPVVQEVGGWLLRATPSVRSRRSNSVLPQADTPPIGVEERLALVDDFYARHGEPVRYQISPAASPEGLDAILEGRGFEAEAPVLVETAPLDGVVTRMPSPLLGPVRLTPAPPPEWMATWTTLFQRGDAEVTRRLILDRIAPPAGFVLLEADGSPIAVGMGVVERRWVGIFSMATVQEHRRRGAATAVLNALARWGLELGAKDAYLQVEEENEAARSLYERLGFRPAYRYHYRIRRASQTAEGGDR